MPKLLAIIGKAGSGKTTVAKYLSQYKAYTIQSFANNLKKIVSESLGMSSNDLERIKNETMYFDTTSIDTNYISVCTDIDEKVISECLYKFEKVTPRQLLQVVGTDIIRKCNPNWHIQQLNIESKSSKVCFDDTRFHNELKYIRENGGKVVHIQRDFGNTSDTHISENELNADNADFIIVNDSSLSELFSKIDEITSRL